MLFFTLILIVAYAVWLIRGNPLADTVIKNGELELKKYEGEDELDIQVKQIKGMVAPVLGLLLLFIVQVIYLLSAIHHDPYKYPTLAIIAYIVFNIITSMVKKKKEKPDLTTERGRVEFRKNLYKNHRYTFKSTIIRLVYLAYYIYMLYVIVFI